MCNQLLRHLAGWLALLSIGAALLVGLAEYQTSDAELLADLQADVQADFIETIREARDLSAPGGQNGSRPDIVMLDVRADGRVEYWSSQQFVPNESVLRDHLQRPRNYLLEYQNQVYYSIRKQKGSLTRLTLVPLRVSYPIQNEYLSDYVFLGRYSTAPEVVSEITAQSFGTLPVRQGVNIADGIGTHLFSIRITDTTPLRQPYKRMAVVLAFGAAMLGFVWLAQQLRRSVRNRLLREAVLIGALVGARALLLMFDLPGQYVLLELFSPRVLALDELTPSLGDLTLNALLVLVVVLRLYRLFAPHTLANRLSGLGFGGWLAFHVVTLAASCGLYFYFFHFFEALAINSKTYLAFTDLYLLNYQSALLFLDVALLLLAVFLIVYFLAGVSRELTRQTHPGFDSRWALVALTCLVLALFHVPWVDIVGFGAFVSLVFLLREQQPSPRLNFSLVSTLLLVAALAATTNLAIARALRKVTENNLVFYAAKYAKSQDLIAEYIFDEVAQNIQTDRTLWVQDSSLARTDTLPRVFLSRLVTNHLASNFPGYDFRVFAYDSRGTRVDNQPWAPYSQLSFQKKRAGRTLSHNLFFVPDTREGGGKFIYVGQFMVNSPWTGRRYLQVELHPKATSAVRQLPSLMVDFSLRQKLSLPPEYEVGIYRNGLLIRRDGNSALPTRLVNQQLKEPAYQESATHLAYLLPQADGRMVMVQAARPTWFERLTAFSLLYYFFILLYGVYLLPGLLRRLLRRRKESRGISFGVRVQFYLAMIGFIPLLALWLPSMKLFTDLYVEDARSDLQQTLQTVTILVEGDTVSLHALRNPSADPAPALDYINRISNLLLADINVYTLDGRLFNTTRRRVYQGALGSSFMNPEAYEALRLGQRSEIVLEETIGGLKYLSGYISLLDARGEIRGYLNLPLLSSQDLLENQVRKFTAYLVNLYVILILGVIVGGLFVSKSLTNPLRLLKQKIDKTSLGARNEPLEWKSNDEIGSIITSYNHMLKELEESEKVLAKTQRELAWREMARQIAHEIKNPLTPMRLSIQQLIRALDSMFGGKEGRPPQVEKLANTLLTQIDSLSTIASSFSNFASMPQDRKAVHCLQDVVGQVYDLYAENEQAEVSLAMTDRRLHAEVDAEQLTRVLVNLMQNALQAMPAKGSISISLSVEGGHALISIADTGAGVPEDIQHRIFEPNFSTKNSGMGLGLAISRRIVENMNGDISFTSVVGRGTTFVIRLPLHVPASSVSATRQ